MRSAAALPIVLALVAAWPALADGQSVVDRRAKQNYLTHCMGCHGESGAGFADQVPALRGPMAAFARTAEGRAYLMRVPGVTQTFLSAQEVAEVMNWALREFNGAAAAQSIAPFTAGEIAAARGQPLLEVVATRERLTAAPVIRR